MLARIDQAAAELERLVGGLEARPPVGYVHPRPYVAHRSTPEVFVDQRWLALGKTQLQQGLMALRRAVAKPDSF